jgi:hypothetical protein
VSSALLFLWAVAFVLLPGLAFSRSLLSSREHRSGPERIAWALALGGAALGASGLILHHAGLFSWWWPLTLIAAAAAVLLTRGPRLTLLTSLTLARPDFRDSWLFGALVTIVLGAEAAMTRGIVEYGFGQDVYYWAGMARQVALGGSRDLIQSMTSPAPSGYGFLLATAASIAPAIHHNSAVVVLVLLWTTFSACAAFALARRLAGTAWGAVAAVVYLGSYWTLYFLVPGVSRQAWAMGVAPLVLLVLVRKGHRAFRAPEIYLLFAAAWLMHALTALMLLCCLPPLVFQSARRRGFRALERDLGPAGTLGAVALLFLPLVVLGRFTLAIPGIVRFIEHPYFYVMKPMDPGELARTLGPATLLTLALGALALRHGFEGARGRARLLGLTLLVLLLSIGAFHQVWYRSASLGLPPHRYYLFYSLVALVWSGALRSLRRLGRAALAAGAALALAQLLFNASFVRRMLSPSPDVLAVLGATKWVEFRSGLDETVVVSLALRDRAAQARHILSPRPVVLLPPEADLGEDGARARFLLTDRGALPPGLPVRFQEGSPPVSVVELSSSAMQSKNR